MVIVLDREGQEIDLVSLWKDRIVVLCWLRHFGCRFCKQQLAAISSIKPQLDKSQISLIAISMGTVEQLKAFKKETCFEGELYVDTDPQNPASYALTKLNKGKELVLNEKTQEKGELAIQQGFTDSEWTGDITQLGGVFVLGPGNTCDYAFRSAYAGDHPDIQEVLAAATGSANPETSNYIFPSTAAWIKAMKSEEKATSSETSTIAKSINQIPILFNKSHQFRELVFVVLSLLAVLVGIYMKSDLSPSFLLVSFSSAIIMCLYFFKKQLFIPSESTQSPNSESKKLPQELQQVQLYTPSQIDQLSIERGCINCDCGSLKINVSDYKAPGDIPAGITDINSSSLSCGDLVPFDVTNCYVREFLAKPHPLLGRKGPTCPFVPAALKQNTIFVGVIKTGSNVDRSVIVQLVKKYVPIFEELEPRSGSKALNKAIILVFPDIQIADAHELIDGTQMELKAEFVARGLMLGEFHLMNNTPGLHNSNFFPLRTPYPSLAIRHMVPSDLVFLSPESYPAETRAKFLKSYIQRFQDSDSNQSKVEQAKEQLKLIAVSSSN